MAEYIDRDALLDSLPVAWDSAVRAIKDAPAEDVERVVHCKDCRSYNLPRIGWCEVHLDRENPDDFCSYGKYKTNGGAE